MLRKRRSKLVAVSLLLGLTIQGMAQSIPAVPFDLDFAGVTIHVNESGRQNIQQEVNRLYNNRSALQRSIETLRQLGPLIDPILTDQHLPADFRYALLPSESGTSPAYWGITRINGMNLRVDKIVDERLHPTLATEAFAVRIRRLNETYGNYVSSLVQYLLTMEQVDSQQSPGSRNSGYLLLDAQSPPLIWKILARKIVFGREDARYHPPKTFLIYTYYNGGGESLRGISQRLGISEERLMPFNSWLLAKQVPTDKEYPVLALVAMDEFPAVRKAAEGRSEATVVSQQDLGFPVLAKLPSSSIQSIIPAVYYSINNRLGVQAQPCDNLITLAFCGDISIKKFLKYNELTQQHVVEPGHIYYLEIKAKRAKVPYHVVQKNQTLREVSDMYGVQLKWLLYFNHISATQRVQSGRIIWMQRRRPLNQPVEYQVVPPTKNTPAEERITPTFVQTEPAPAPPVSSPKTVAGEPNQRSRVTALPVPKSTTKGDSLRRVVTSVRPDTVWDDPDERLQLHTVKPGQTYFSIARLYGVTVNQLYMWNKGSARTPLRVGQPLIVDLSSKKRPSPDRSKPVTSAPPQAQRTAKPVNDALLNLYMIEPAKKATYHTVQAGQTVYRVAVINNVSVENIVRWNRLQNYVLKVGQKLVIYK